MEIYIAKLETRNYEFTAYGESEDHARETLRPLFEKFMKLNGGSLTWSDVTDDVYVSVAKPGQAFVR